MHQQPIRSNATAAQRNGCLRQLFYGVTIFDRSTRNEGGGAYFEAGRRRLPRRPASRGCCICYRSATPEALERKRIIFQLFINPTRNASGLKTARAPNQTYFAQAIMLLLQQRKTKNVQDHRVQLNRESITTERLGDLNRMMKYTESPGCRHVSSDTDDRVQPAAIYGRRRGNFYNTIAFIFMEGSKRKPPEGVVSIRQINRVTKTAAKSLIKRVAITYN
jgi:hypothetical protein